MGKADKRKQEILDATAKLYEAENYKDINIQKIAAATSMSRPSIYNYFETKEEIFLALLEEQYLCWTAELEKLLAQDLLGKTDFLADRIAASLEQRPLMLKLIANNIADFEDNSRIENIVHFKKAYGATLDIVDKLLLATKPDWTEQEREEIIYSFFPYLYGLHPYTVATSKQVQGLKTAKVDFHFHSVYELTYNLLKKLLH